MRTQAIAAMSRGRVAEAAAALDDLLAAFPGDVPSMALLGEARLRLGDLEGARQILELALARRGDSADAALHLAHVHRLAGRPDAALAAFEQALEASPGHVTALLDAAQIAFENGQAERALDYGQRALATGHVPPAELGRVEATVEFLRDEVRKQAGEELPPPSDG